MRGVHGLYLNVVNERCEHLNRSMASMILMVASTVRLIISNMWSDIGLKLVLVWNGWGRMEEDRDGGFFGDVMGGVSLEPLKIGRIGRSSDVSCILGHQCREKAGCLVGVSGEIGGIKR
jgi:hypothetical protein